MSITATQAPFYRMAGLSGRSGKPLATELLKNIDNTEPRQIAVGALVSVVLGDWVKQIPMAALVGVDQRIQLVIRHKLAFAPSQLKRGDVGNRYRRCGDR
jgi:hypothetical protein